MVISQFRGNLRNQVPADGTLRAVQVRLLILGEDQRQ